MCSAGPYHNGTWSLYQYKDGLSMYGISIIHINIRWSWDSLIFTMGIPILIWWHLYNKTVPWQLFQIMLYLHIWFNWLTPGRCSCNLRLVFFHIKDKNLEHFLWNCFQVNVTKTHWWLINNGWGNCLVPSRKTSHCQNQCWPRTVSPLAIWCH